jgi:hypothetical protein
MDALSDTLAKHGVLAADKKPVRGTGGRFAPKPKDQPIYKQAKIGDWVRTKRVYDTAAGTYEVTHVDNDPTTGYRLAINNPGKNNRRWWLHNDAVVEIVPKPEQKAEIDFSKIKVGDSVRVSKTKWFEAGTYKVLRVNISDVLIDTVGDSWYAGPSHIEEHIPATPPEPLWKSLKSGDIIEITSVSDGTSFWMNRKAGVFEVVEIDHDQHAARDLRILTRDKDTGDQLGWVSTDRLVRVVVDEPKAEPAELTVWKDVEVGDMVRVQGSSYVDDGVHKVLRINGHSDREIMRVRDLKRGEWWVGKMHVTEIVSKARTEIDDTPAYLKAKMNDTVRVEGSGGIEDGNYRVMDIDEGDSMRLQVDDGDGGYWVPNDYVKAIVDKPKATSPGSLLKPVTTVQVPVYRQAKVGDTIRVAGYRDYKAGNYFVVRAEPDRYTGLYNLEVKLSDRAGDTTWVRNEDVLEIVTGTELAKDVEAFRRAKVGDTVRLAKGQDHPAGEYVVTRVDEDATFRLGVDYDGRNDRVWWVRNSVVEAVVTTRQGAVAVRGNCLIHVDVPTIMSNRSNNRHEPVIVARRLSDIGTVERFRELAWDGPSRFVHHHFQRIEGTDIQNWVETDAPLTAWKPDGEIDVLNPIPGTVLDDMRAMTKPILGAFVIHIAAPVLAKNRKEGRNDPVIAVRRAHTNWATDVVFARKVEWNGPSRMVHRPSTPIPGTEGRGVSFVETDADVTVYLDNQEPIVLTMPPLRAAA